MNRKFAILMKLLGTLVVLTIVIGASGRIFLKDTSRARKFRGVIVILKSVKRINNGPNAGFVMAEFETIAEPNYQNNRHIDTMEPEVLKDGKFIGCSGPNSNAYPGPKGKYVYYQQAMFKCPAGQDTVTLASNFEIIPRNKRVHLSIKNLSFGKFKPVMKARGNFSITASKVIKNQWYNNMPYPPGTPPEGDGPDLKVFAVKIESSFPAGANVIYSAGFKDKLNRAEDASIARFIDDPTYEPIDHNMNTYEKCISFFSPDSAHRMQVKRTYYAATKKIPAKKGKAHDEIYLYVPAKKIVPDSVSLSADFELLLDPKDIVHVVFKNVPITN